MLMMTGRKNKKFHNAQTHTEHDRTTTRKIRCIVDGCSVTAAVETSLGHHSIIAAENVDASVDGDFAISFKCLRRIFPAAERGISGRISTPPRSLLYATTCPARQQ